MQLTKNFNSHEFDCHDGTPVPIHLIGNVQKLADQLQILRDYLWEPVKILSGYRTKTWNKKVGGKKASYHLKAMAGDVVVKSKTPKQLAAIVEKLIKEKKLWFGGLGVYPGFIHVDIRKYQARW